MSLATTQMCQNGVGYLSSLARHRISYHRLSMESMSKFEAIVRSVTDISEGYKPGLSAMGANS